MSRTVCGVDVGTRSARAGIFAPDGTLLGRAEHPIAMRQTGADQAEQDSEDIWRAVASAVRQARQAAGVAAGAVAAIGFDATCSLVLRGRDGGQVAASADGGDRWDTIVWLDHRAVAEAEECTATGDPVLATVGGTMSPEMALPKLMWLKRRLPASWARTGLLFDLADFLTWRASGSTARSHGTLSCKWGYAPLGQGGWPTGFLARLGLDDAITRGGLPQRATPVATDLGALSDEAADALGLTTGCRVAAGLIDAYAGALAVLGGSDAIAAGDRLALIAGTSSCVMTLADGPVPLAGFWGPYRDVPLPGLWTSEGGQSATGGLLDHLIATHGGGLAPDAATHGRIAARIAELRAAEGIDLAGRLHVLPDFHGRRSPDADPRALGVISGLTLDASFDGLCRLYWRSCVGIALGLRSILDALEEAGVATARLNLAGGHTRNPLLMELYADATGRTVNEPKAEDTMSLGAAITAAPAAGLFGEVAAAARAMGPRLRERRPNPAHRARFEHDYRVFQELQRQRKAIDALG